MTRGRAPDYIRSSPSTRNKKRRMNPFPDSYPLHFFATSYRCPRSDIIEGSSENELDRQENC